MSSMRGVTVFMGDALERRVNGHRVNDGKIRSFSDVAREAMEKGLGVMERERRESAGATPESVESNAAA
ncbi:hypothetical protein BE17_07650 [Sorangium cellulosum]|uniref:Uncharacterized protein n=1 Tax=Sorangium cellulosum TaxID=56 RepID=A0A150T1H5_SORCE|nr:hypothetical protein BE17_07650 [Sorangium cellulosum]